MRRRAFFTLGLMFAVGIACSSPAEDDPPTADPSMPFLEDGAPNPGFDAASPPPRLPDGAPNPAFDASGPGADSGRDSATPPADSGRDSATPPVDSGRDSATPPVDSGRDSATPPVDSGRDSGPPPANPGVVGNDGPADWDALAASEKLKVRTFRSFFLHQSVGGDLEDGSQAVGYRFSYVTSGSTSLSAGLNGGLFSSSNGNPTGKINEFRNMAIANAGNLRVAIMKFGYADVLSGSLAGAQNNYLTAVNAVKAQGVRVLHVTPPFVYNVPSENAPKMQMRTWMIATFASDVIFDLQDIESTQPGTGTRCERGGSWEICNSIRSTSGCPSLNQGVDSASGQGHICYNPHAQRIAKAFLYSIYRAGN